MAVSVETLPLAPDFCSSCTSFLLIQIGPRIREYTNGVDITWKPSLHIDSLIDWQDPVLFKGTIRLNLDPFERHTDAEINEAISRVHLSKKIKSLTNGIDSLVAEYGANFSVGQRQLLCLARSLLKRFDFLSIWCILSLIILSFTSSMQQCSDEWGAFSNSAICHI